MDSPCIKHTVCNVLKIFQHGKYLVAYVLKSIFRFSYLCDSTLMLNLSKYCKTEHIKGIKEYFKVQKIVYLVNDSHGTVRIWLVI